MFSLGDKNFTSRLLTGTGKFGSAALMCDAIKASGSELVTLAMKRVDSRNPSDNIYAPLRAMGVQLLPNTSGARNAEEAIFIAKLAREATGTHWLKLEIHPDPRYLMPDPIETLAAAKKLVELGFVVLPYMHADPVLALRLQDCGCAAVMPLGAPIGSNLGLKTRDFLHIIIEQVSVPVIVDAGIGAPSHAMAAMEMGASAVLVNTAIATGRAPMAMARAFAQAVAGGRNAYLAGLPVASTTAHSSSPLTGFLEGVGHGL